MDSKKLTSFVSLLANLLGPKNNQAIDQVAAPAKDTSSPVTEKVYKWNEINWNDPNAKIAKYFTVKDAIFLRDWNRMATSADGLNDTVKKNLVEAFRKMDLIREYLAVPVFIKSAYRPSAYNIAIGGAQFSAHMCDKDYAAVDFWCDKDGDGDKDGDDCDLIKDRIRPKLLEWNIRMEINGKGARWVHVDTKPVPSTGHREFHP